MTSETESFADGVQAGGDHDFLLALPSPRSIAAVSSDRDGRDVAERPPSHSPCVYRMPAWLRIRLPYVALAVATIAIGLAVHIGGRAVLDRIVRDVTGDALWAMMMAWWLGAVAPASRISVRGAAALAVCFAVEFSQLYRAPTLDALRATLLGHLVLGSGFDPRDLLAYTVGVVMAVLAERALHRRGARTITPVATPRPTR